LTTHVNIKSISSPSKVNLFALNFIAFYIVTTYYAITDKTSKSMRLNSSKQHQAPLDASPLKNLLIA